MAKKKIYFASDFHLGSPNTEESLKRERDIVRWLDLIKLDAKKIYLVGDIFDFWFEYKKVVPKGFVRLLGKLAELTDSGIEIDLFVGNHDLWMYDYLIKEIGIKIHYQPKIIEEQSKKIFIGHGDGLGKGEYEYKILKKLFTSKICQWLFASLHPDLAFSLAHAWSRRSRKKKQKPFISKDEELLFKYCEKQENNNNNIDYYIFGHRHIPLELKINKRAKYINLGEWINKKTYAVLKEGELTLEEYN